MLSVISQTIVTSGLISVEVTGKKSAEARSGEYGGCFSVVTLFFAKESFNKATGVLKHSRKAETNCWFSVFTTSVRRRRLSSTFLYSHFYINFPDAAIPVNYTSEFRERFEGSVYIQGGA